MVYEVLRSSVAEVWVGACSEIAVTLRDDNQICVRDNSKGIAVDVAQHTGLSKLELILTRTTISNQTFAEARCPYPIMGGLYGLQRYSFECCY